MTQKRGSLFGVLAPIGAMTRTAILVTPNSSRKQLQDLARGPITAVYETGPSKVRAVLRDIERDATRDLFGCLVVPTLKVGVGIRALVRFLRVLGELEVQLVCADQPGLILCEEQALLLRFLGATLDEERKSNIQAGAERARRAGRGPGRPKVSIPPRVFELADEGLSLRAIAREVGLGTSTVGRALAARRVLRAHPQVSDSGEVI